MSISLSLSQLAEHLGAELAGDAERVITGVAALESARREDISFLARRKYLPYLAATKAAAVLVSRELGDVEVPPATTLLWVDDAHLALARRCRSSIPKPNARQRSRPPPYCPGVELGTDVSIGPYSVVEAGARLGDAVRVGPLCFIGENCVSARGLS